MDLIAVDFSVVVEALGVYIMFFVGVFCLSGVVNHFANG